MARTAIGVTTSAITWEPLKSDMDVSDTADATITVVGAVDAHGISLVAAYSLIPDTIPISPTGPVGNATELSGAKVGTKNVHGEDGFWWITATYKKSLAPTADYDGTERSNNDRAERRIILVQEPLLSHPVVRAMPRKERNKLKLLLDGVIFPSPDYDPETEGSAEFVKEDTDGEEVEMEFSDEDVTADGVTASPLDYARLLKAGIETYSRKTVRHVWSISRNNPASNADYRKVGRIVTSPPLAPVLASGFQWMLTGIIDRTENGDAWNADYEYDASGAGGYLQEMYEGGGASIDDADEEEP